MSLDFIGENEFGFFILKNSIKNKYPILELQNEFKFYCLFLMLKNWPK